MKVNLVCYEDIDSWVLGMMATRLRYAVLEHGISCNISKHPDSSADINHHICYINYDGQRTTAETLMITHIDTDTEFERVRFQLLVAEMGVCLSSETMGTLADRGLPRSKLCFINPAHDGDLPPRKIAIGLASRLYEDGRKREWILLEVAERISPNDFRFHIIGSGWEAIVERMRAKGFSVEYDSKFDKCCYAAMMSTIDYYVYLGVDEGSMGFLDALAAGVPTIVTPQGFHLDAPGGISHSFIEAPQLVGILAKLAEEKKARQRAVAAWTWGEHAHRHIALWECVLARKAGLPVPERLWSTLQAIGVDPTRKPAPDGVWLEGRASDGWMAPHAKLWINYGVSEQLVLNVEVPGWLPFRYPVKLEATRGGTMVQSLQVWEPGKHELILPLHKEGLIELRSDQWFVPAELEIGSADTRRISYRILDTTVCEKAVTER
jgi:hypothetical protein